MKKKKSMKSSSSIESRHGHAMPIDSSSSMMKNIFLFLSLIIIIILLSTSLVVEATTTTPNLLFRGDEARHPLGINVGPLDYEMSQWVFTNRFKHAKEWRPVGSLDYWQSYYFEGTITTNWSRDGYPLGFQSKYIKRCYGYQTEFGTLGKYPTGNYILTFGGSGNFSILGDATNVKQVNRNRFEFTVYNTSTKGIVLIVTEPNVYDVVLREAREENVTSTFSPDFIRAIQPFSVLRFSSWMIGRVYGNSITNCDKEWADRRPATFYTQQGQAMVSIEYIVELGNYLNKDIWISIPNACSADHIMHIATYVRDNLNSSLTIHVEQSADKGWGGNNRNLNIQLINIFKTVFGMNDTRCKYILSTLIPAYYDSVLSLYSSEDLSLFHAFAVSGNVGTGIEYYGNDYDVRLSANYTVNDVLNLLKQEIYRDELDWIYLINRVAYKLKIPLIVYDAGLRIHAPGWANRWKKTELAPLEQRLEDLSIEALRQPIVEDMVIDFMKRWHRMGGGLMILNNIVDKSDRCLGGGGRCGYQAVMESLLQNPQTVPKYRAALSWFEGGNGSLPFTSDDVPKPVRMPCNECKYGVCHNGSCHCFDGFSGPSCNISVSKYQDCSSNTTKFGVNVDGLADWSRELTFIDIHRRARKWIVQKFVYGTAWAEDSDQETVPLDENGYPKYLELIKNVATLAVRDVGAHFPNGKYICLYDGDGVLEFQFEDQKILRRDAGRIELQYTHKTEMNNGVFYKMLRTNPMNPIRNIRIFEAKYEQTYEDFPYHPLFLEHLKKYQIIRFMPWSRIGEDQEYDWENRTHNSYYTFTLKTGVSMEMQVLLCNMLGNNPWFNLPHRASDRYIENWATYVRDHLRPDVTAYIEIGNECWANGACGYYAQQMGVIEGMKLTKLQAYYNSYEVARICYHIKTGKKYADIIRRVFGEEHHKRIKLVFAAQAAWTGPLEIFYLCEGNYYQSFNVVAIAPYLSNSLKNSDNSLITVDEFYGSIVHKAIAEARTLLLNTYKIVNQSSTGMELAFYEGGPDLSSLTDTGNTELTELSMSLHRDPRMKQALTYYLSNMTNIAPGVKLNAYNHFTSISVYSRYGCWGLAESSDSDLSLSPKYIAYQDYIDSMSTCKWNEKPSTCKNNCSNRGVCAPNALSDSRDSCHCYFGYNGTSCEVVNYITSYRCTYQCGGRGDCLFNHTEGFYAVHTCHCQTGYYGYGCTLFTCDSKCNYNGNCIDYNKCSCYRGFTGSNCSIDCGCNGVGYCATNSTTCVCDYGYSLVNGKCEIDCKKYPTHRSCLKCPSLGCANGICLNGTCSCHAGYRMDSRSRCTIKANSPNDGSKLGVNVNGVVDYSPQWTFVDLMKQARAWILQDLDGMNTLYVWSYNDEIKLRSDGYPASIAQGKQLVTLMLRDIQQKWPGGIYHVFYEGNGLLDFGFDSTIIENNQKGYMKIKVTLSLVRDNGVFMKIKETNPNNPIRNIRIVMDGFENTYQDNPFHPLFLKRLENFKTIRFMSWTLEKDIVSWEDRVLPSSLPKARGVAHEYMIQLCNILKANPWFTIPYGANDEYIRQFAILAKQTLRNDVQIYLEYTNEAWNTLFDSGKYCEEQGKLLGLSTDSLTARNLFYSKRSKEIITIWKSVFGSSDSNRLTLVAASFTVMPITSTRILSYQDLYKSHSNIMLTVTGYFGCGLESAGTLVAISDLNTLFKKCDDEFASIKSMLEQQLQIAKSYNVTLGMYESGSSVAEYSAIASGYETAGATDKYIAMNRDIKMYDVYKKYYRMYANLSLVENCHYANVGFPSKYGSWHLLEYQYQDISEAHRFRAIQELIVETRGPITRVADHSCFGMLYNSSKSCSGNGICVNQNLCQCDSGYINEDCSFYLDGQTRAFATENNFTITPASGTALTHTFTLSSKSWLASSKISPLQYAFGFVNGKDENVILTKYSQYPNATTILPFTKQSTIPLVMFVKDATGNVISLRGASIIVSAFSGTSQELSTRINSLSSEEKIVAFYDESSSSLVSTQLVNTLSIDTNNSQQVLKIFETVTSSPTVDKTALESVSTKLDSFLVGMSHKLLNGSQAKLSTEETQSAVSIISNIYEYGSETKAESLISNIASVLVMSINPVESNSSSVNIQSSSFKISVSSFNISNVLKSTGGTTFVYDDISTDISSIYKDSSTMAAISLVKYSYKTSTRRSVMTNLVSDQIDLKFYSSGQPLALANLTKPIELKFTLKVLVSQSAMQKQLVCKYYDEQKLMWSSEGCKLASVDYANSVVTCSCDHTTKFAVDLVQETTIPQASSIVVNPPSTSPKKHNSLTISGGSKVNISLMITALLILLMTSLFF